MKAHRVIEFDCGLLVKYPHIENVHLEIRKMERQLGSKVTMFRDVWDSVEAFQEYKQKERESIESQVKTC